jgi:hypothetical protein
MKRYFIAATVAAVISGGVAFYAPIKQVTHEIAASKHAWTDLTDAEKARFAELAKGLPSGVKFDIVCNDASCSDLAADLDDAFEDAGRESVLDKAIGPLGYGIGVQADAFDKPAAEATITALIDATNGRLQPSLAAGKGAPGFVTILIGKRPR